MTQDAPFEPPSRKKRITVAAIVLALGALIGGGVYWWINRPKPFGVESRVPWSMSKVLGSPDPADPYIVERIFPSLKFDKPVDVVLSPRGNRVIVVQKDGQIVSFANDPSSGQAPSTDSASSPQASSGQISLALDLKQLGGLKRIPGYQGIEAYSFAFDPAYKDNRFCYVCYQIVFPIRRSADYDKHYPDNKTASRVSRFVAVAPDPLLLDRATEKILIQWPGGGNNGGCIRFGKDGNLYISTGDNGNGESAPPAAADSAEVAAAQDIKDLRGKILRIDVDKPSPDLPYSIPADNPFRDPRFGRPEVFALGLRNPRRLSFDQNTGDLWAADEGWELWASILRVENGGNYGWNVREGPGPPYPNRSRGPATLLAPDLALPHSEAGALTGGFVYHGKQLPELANQYLFGDRDSRRIWAAPLDGLKLGKYRMIAQTELRISAFAEDAGGEAVIADSAGGGLWRIARNPAGGTEQPFPRKLSETGLFADVAKQLPNPGVLPFNVNTPQWVDGSSSERFVAIASNENVRDADDGTRLFPTNTVLARTLSLAMVTGDASTRKRIETQLLHFDGVRWHGYAYQWNDDQTDAALVGPDGRDVELTIVDPAAPGAKRTQAWHFNSRTQCMGCHTHAAGYTLAFTEPQLDRTEQYQTAQNGRISDNQLRSFRHVGLIPEAKPPTGDSAPPAPLAFVNPYEDDPKTLDDRARAYLHVNCASCHRTGGSGGSVIDLRREMTVPESRMLSVPMLGAFDLPDCQIVCPGDPCRSVLYYRITTTGAGRMPHVGCSLIDEKGIELIARWIVSLRGTHAAVPLGEETRKLQGLQGDALQKLQAGADGLAATTLIDKLLKTPDGALRLLTALQEGRLAPKLLPLAVERALQSSSPQTVRDLFIRFAPQRAGLLEKLGVTPGPEKIQQLLATPGDVTRGQKIFFEFAGGLCSRCHRVDQQGAEFGPDLSHLGATRKKSEILGHILDPSKSITPGFETHIITTKFGETWSGLLKNKSDSETVLIDVEGKLTRVRADQIAKEIVDPRSAMPDGMLADLDLQQAADLLEFLATRK